MAQYIVVTRPIKESRELKKKLEELGLSVFSFPSIRIHKTVLTTEIQKPLKNLASFDWIVFTSQNGVRFFIEALNKLRIDIEILRTKRIATVGPKTAAEAKKYHLPVTFIPSEFTTKDLAQQLEHIEGKTILLPRANIATPTLTESLKAKGALVTNIAIYITEFTTTQTNEFETLLEHNEIRCITFTSPSTIEGFLKHIQGIQKKAEILSLPVLSIGPVTTEALKKHDFKKIYTADEYTIEGMFSKLKESIL